jgi:hypothetical protein
LQGALLAELMLRSRLGVDGRNLVVLDGSSTGDDLLDGVLAMVATAQRPRHVGYWVSHRLVVGLERRVAERAATRRVIRLRERTVLGRSVLRYRLERPLVRLWLLNHLIDSLFTSGGGDIRSRTLLGLLHAAGATSGLVAPPRRRSVTERLDRLSRRPGPAAEVIKAVAAARAAAVG